MDGKHSKKGNDVSVNAVQSTSEDRIEQLIASALEEFAINFKSVHNHITNCQ